MANYCDYEVRVKGSKKAGIMIYESMPFLDYKDFEWKRGAGGSTIICFRGNCKWSVNYGVTDNLKHVNVDSMSESEIKDNGTDYYEYSLRAKSEAFQCEIMVRYWSEESGFDKFDHYRNGKLLKQRKIEFNYEEQNNFDWDKLEFVGHEGEYDERVDGEEKNENFMAMFFGLEGSKSENTVIGDTESDIYKWTFEEEKIVEGNGWTIAIPDGYEKVKARDADPTTGKTRLFELVPQTYKKEKNENIIPIRILPGTELDVQEIDENWMYHPIARAGMAGIIGATRAEFVRQMMGEIPELLSVGWADVAAYIMIIDTSGGSYSYQITVIREKIVYMLRVQTQCISSAQKHALSKSIIKWLCTMRFDKPNKACPSKSKMEEKSIFNELIKEGITDKLEDAVEQAKIEYNISIAGKLKMVEFMADNGILDDHALEYMKEIMMDGMIVKEYYLEKADELIKRLQKAGVEFRLLKKVLRTLHDLDEDQTVINLGKQKVTIEVPLRIKEIRDEWRNIEKGTSKTKVVKDKESLPGGVSEIQALEAFEVTDDIKILRAFIRRFKKSWSTALAESNKAILNEKSTPIIRYNDSRIKKIAINSEEVVNKFANKLQEVMVKIDQIGEEKREGSTSEEEIIAVCELISMCFEKLHIETSVKLYKEEKKVIYSVDEKYNDISKKWEKIYDSLPSVRIQELQKLILEKKQNLDDVKKQLVVKRKKRARVEKEVEEAESAYFKLKMAFDEGLMIFEKKNEYFTKGIVELNTQLSKISSSIAEVQANILEQRRLIKEKESEYLSNITARETEKREKEIVLQRLNDDRNTISSEEVSKRLISEKAIFFKKKKVNEHEEALLKLREKDKEISECNAVIIRINENIETLKKQKQLEIDFLEGSKEACIARQDELLASKVNKEEMEISLEKDFKDAKRIFENNEREFKDAEKHLEMLKIDLEQVENTILNEETEKKVLQEDIEKIKKQIIECKSILGKKNY